MNIKLKKQKKKLDGSIDPHWRLSLGLHRCSSAQTFAGMHTQTHFSTLLSCVLFSTPTSTLRERARRCPGHRTKNVFRRTVFSSYIHN